MESTEELQVKDGQDQGALGPGQGLTAGNDQKGCTRNTEGGEEAVVITQVRAVTWVKPVVVGMGSTE